MALLLEQVVGSITGIASGLANNPTEPERWAGLTVCMGLLTRLPQMQVRAYLHIFGSVHIVHQRSRTCNLVPQTRDARTDVFEADSAQHARTLIGPLRQVLSSAAAAYGRPGMKGSETAVHASVIHASAALSSLVTKVLNGVKHHTHLDMGQAMGGRAAAGSQLRPLDPAVADLCHQLGDGKVSTRPASMRHAWGRVIAWGWSYAPAAAPMCTPMHPHCLQEEHDPQLPAPSCSSASQCVLGPAKQRQRKSPADCWYVNHLSPVHHCCPHCR
jgi:hypothetical protein